MQITVVSGSLDPWTTPDRPDWSGRARHLSEVVDTLAAGGHHVDAVAPGDPSIDPPGGGPVVHRVAGMAGAPPDRVVEALTAALRRLWRGGRPDVVHAYHWTAVLAARSAAPGVPVAQLVHGAAMEAGGGRGAVERAVLRDVDRVLVTSVEDRRRLFAAGVEPDRLQIVPATVDTDEFRPAGPTLRRGERPRLVALGGLGLRSGAEYAVRALTGVPAAELLLAGGRPAGEPDADRDRLFALAARCGVADRVRFLGPVGRVDVPRLLRSADVVVCPEPYWTTGFGALEGMACGCAVVSAQVSAHTDLVVDQVSGLVVAPRDAAALARGLRTALKGRSRCQALGLAGRNRVEAAYRRAHGVEAMDQALDRARARSAVAG